MRQPYIYTLPEQFIEDPAVPLHWKLYTLINGFWIAGKPVFASNAYFAEKLKCSERYIQMCLEKLEGMNLLERVGKSQNRTIVPKGTNQQFVEGRTGSSVRDEPTVHHISDSSSVSNIGELEIRTEIENERPIREKKDTTYFKVFELWKPYPINWRKNTTQIDAAKNLLEEHGLEDVTEALDYYHKNKQQSYIPEILTPSDLDRKWLKLAAYSLKNK